MDTSIGYPVRLNHLSAVVYRWTNGDILYLCVERWHRSPVTKRYRSSSLTISGKSSPLEQDLGSAFKNADSGNSSRPRSRLPTEVAFTFAPFPLPVSSYVPIAAAWPVPPYSDEPAVLDWSIPSVRQAGVEGAGSTSKLLEQRDELEPAKGDVRLILGKSLPLKTDEMFFTPR